MADRYYFAYGSNLNREDWEQACEKRGFRKDLLKFHALGYLPDYELAFTYRSKGRKGGALDVRLRLGQAVAGVVFEVVGDGWEALDKKEGHPKYYERMPATVITEGGQELDVITYRVVEARREAFVAPAPEYVEIVRRGLQAYDLPDDALDAAARGEETPWLTDGLFVYGTLMRGEGRFDILKAHRIECALLARSCGRLVDLGSFPGLLDVGTAETTVEGEFIRVRDLGRALVELDRVEGCRGGGQAGSLFVRTLVSVDVGEGRVRRAWTYRFNGAADGVPVIKSGCWRERCGRRGAFLRELVAAHTGGDELAVARAMATQIPFSMGGDQEVTARGLLPLEAAIQRGAVSERKLAQMSGQWTACC